MTIRRLIKPLEAFTGNINFLRSSTIKPRRKTVIEIKYLFVFVKHNFYLFCILYIYTKNYQLNTIYMCMIIAQWSINEK